MTILDTAPLEVEPSAKERRLARWRQFGWLREHSIRRAARQCYTPVSGTVTVGVTADGVVHVKGTKRCGSVWACPHCAPMIREARAVKVDQLLRRALDAGCELRFLTVTIQHHMEHRLEGLWEPLQACYSAGFGGRAAQPGRQVIAYTAEDLNVAGAGVVLREETMASWFWGQVRGIDLTDGVNGWHPHIHSVLVFAPGTEPHVIDEWLNARRERFRWSLRAWGLYSAADERGWCVRDVEAYGDGDPATAIARYTTKVDGGWGAGLELTRTDLKSGRRGGRTPFQLLAAAADGCSGSARRFREYEAASAGRKLLVTSRRLAAIFGVDPDEGDDAELAEGDPGDEFALQVVYDGDEWCRLLRGGYLGLLIAHLSDAIAHNAGSVAWAASPRGSP